MSDLEQNHPWHYEFLQWHGVIMERYTGPIRAELTSKARAWVVKDINGTEAKKN